MAFIQGGAPGCIFPGELVRVARAIRELYPTVTYDHRPYLHPQEEKIEWMRTELYRVGYSAFKFAVSKVIAPRTLCEIGVGGGIAALAMLAAAPEATYLGIDNEARDRALGVPFVEHAERKLAEHGYQVDILRADSGMLSGLPDAYDLVHVDGDHERAATARDTRLAFDCGARWILIDDARDSNVAAGVWDAIAQCHPGSTEWAYFEDTWTGSILIWRGKVRS